MKTIAKSLILLATLVIGVGAMSVQAATGQVIETVTLELDWTKFKVSESIVEETAENPYQFWITISGEGVEQREDPFRSVWIKSTKAHVEAGYLEEDIYEEIKEDGWAHLSYYSDDYEIGKNDEVRYTLRVQAQEGYYFSENVKIELKSNLMKLESAQVVDSPFYENRDWLELNFKMGTGADVEKVITSPESDIEEVPNKEVAKEDVVTDDTLLYVSVVGVAAIGTIAGTTVIVLRKKGRLKK